MDGVLVDSPHEKAWRESLRELMENEWSDIRDQTTWSPEAFTSQVYRSTACSWCSANTCRASRVSAAPALLLPLLEELLWFATLVATEPAGRKRSPADGRARAKVAGRHLRLGASLARLETRVAFEELLSRFPDFTFDETRVERAYSGNVRGLAKLPLRIERRARYRAWHAPDLETF